MENIEESQNNTYVVIQFIELPYENINKYIIIPHSWIRIFHPNEDTDYVAYPVEDERRTYRRVRNNKEFKPHWKLYKAVVKYEACSIEEAQCWISVATLGSSNQYDHILETEMDHDDELDDVAMQTNKGHVDSGTASMYGDEEVKHNGASSDAANFDAIEDDYDDEDCIILIKEEPIDICDEFDDVAMQINEGHVDSGTASMDDDEEVEIDEIGSDPDNLIAPSNNNLEDFVTSPANGKEVTINNNNEHYGDSNYFVPQTNSDETGMSVAHADESNNDDGDAPRNNNDTNAANSNNYRTDNFVNPVCNKDAVEYIIQAHDKSASGCASPVNNSDTGNHATMNIDNFVLPPHHSTALNNIAMELINNTDDRVQLGHNDSANNSTRSKYNDHIDINIVSNNSNPTNGDIALDNYKMVPVNTNETNKNTTSINEDNRNNNIAQKNTVKHLNNKKSSQNLLCDIGTTSTNNVIQTERPRSVITFEPSKSTRDKPSFFCDSQNQLAVTKSVIKFTKKQQIMNNEKEISERVKLMNHLTKLDFNVMGIQRNSVLQDIFYRQPINLEKHGAFQKNTSPVSVYYWTQDSNSPYHISPSAYVNSFQNNTTQNSTPANGNLHRAQHESPHHDNNKKPLPLPENCSRAESVRPNIQMNHVDQEAFPVRHSQKATNTASTQHLTEYPTFSFSNSRQQMTSANETFALQRSEVSRLNYNNQPVTLQENHSSVESISTELIDYRINKENRIEENTISSNILNAAAAEYLKHGNVHSGQQIISGNNILRNTNERNELSTSSMVYSTTTQEPPRSNNQLYHKKPKRNSAKQSHQNVSNYTVNMQPAQTNISNHIDQVSTSQNIENNPSSSVHNSLSSAPQHWVPSAFQRHVPYVPSSTQIPVGNDPTGSDPKYFQNSFQHNLMVQSSLAVLRNPGHLNAQGSPFIRPTNSFVDNTSTIFPNSSQEPHTQVKHTAISTRTDGVYQGPNFAGHISFGLPGIPTIENQAVPVSGYITTDTDYVVQDTNELNLRNPSNTYTVGQNTFIQSTTMNRPLGVSQYPTANQLYRYSQRSNGQQNVTVFENNPIHETHMQNINTLRPVAVHPCSLNPQPYNQHLQKYPNIETIALNPPVQTNQYCCPNECCNANAAISTVGQNYFQQNYVNAQISTGNATTQSFQYLEENQVEMQRQNCSDILPSTEQSGTNHSENRPNSVENYKSFIHLHNQQLNSTKGCVPKISGNRQIDEQTHQLSSICLDSSDEEISTSEISSKEPNKAIYKIQNVYSKNNKNCLPNTHQAGDLDRQKSLQKIETLLKTMVSMSHKTYLKSRAIIDTYTEDKDIWKKLTEEINTSVDRKSKESLSEVKSQLQNKNKVQNVCLDNDQSLGDDDDDDVDDDDDSEDYIEPPQKKPACRKWRSLVLPEQYNPNDTKWTLQYREASEKLTELISGSNIFVSSIGLDTCKRVAKDYKTLARMLVLEVFNEAALKVCSLTGVRRTYYYRGTELKLRAGLDPKAIKTIITYVETYEDSQGWDRFNLESVNSTMRGKLDQYRRQGLASTSQQQP